MSKLCNRQSKSNKLFFYKMQKKIILNISSTKKRKYCLDLMIYAQSFDQMILDIEKAALFQFRKQSQKEEEVKKELVCEL